MSTAENKLNLVQMIVESNDKTFIDQVLEYARSLRKQKNDEDLPDDIVAGIKRGMTQAKEGRVTSHEAVRERLQKRFPNAKI